MAKKIKIQASGGKDAADFTDCYFLPTNITQEYLLFSKSDVPIVTSPIPLVTGQDFSFSLPGSTWSWNVTSFQISDTSASGNWSNNDPQITDETGTFQAQATIDPEEEEAASSASA